MPALSYMLAVLLGNTVEGIMFTIQPITPKLCFPSDIGTEDDEDGGGGERDCYGKPQPDLSGLSGHVREKGCLEGRCDLPSQACPWQAAAVI